MPKPMTTPTAAEDWRDHIAKLDAEAADAATQIAALEQERAGIALAASLDDPAARERMGAIRAEISDARCRADEAAEAIDAARAEIARLDAEAAAVERKARAKRVRSLVKAGREIATEIDTTMARLSELLGERVANAAALAREGAIAGVAYRRAVSPSIPLHAAHAHGLRERLPIDHVSAYHWRPLAEGGAFAFEAAEAAAAKLAQGIEPNADPVVPDGIAAKPLSVSLVHPGEVGAARGALLEDAQAGWEKRA